MTILGSGGLRTQILGSGWAWGLILEIFFTGVNSVYKHVFTVVGERGPDVGGGKGPAEGSLGAGSSLCCHFNRLYKRMGVVGFFFFFLTFKLRLGATQWQNAFH